MSSIINILPDSVANQIAAGEVVDRPASCVKELLENAIDAGATQIQLILKDAGRTLIQVVDNGCGMTDDDARLCFERHATSKIHKADDLFAIRTMGFRGEALASIAAVAQVELKTRKRGAELGTCVEIEGCEVTNQQPCSCSEGTSISVKNLFYNIPARRNFLKKDSIELSHIDEIFRRVAIVNHTVAFTIYSNGKLLYELRSTNKAGRIADIFGKGSSERFFPVNESTDVVKVEGYVGKPEHVRKTRGEQYIFVNQRFIKHPALSVAIEKAYQELIPERTYPSYFIFLDVDPSRIDVNIHPNKTEVRFDDEHALFAILRAATKRAIGQYSLASEIEFNPSTEFSFNPPPQGYIPPIPTISYNPNFNPFNDNADGSTPSGSPRTSSSVKGNTSTGSGDGIHGSNFAGHNGFKSSPVDSRWENFFQPTSSPTPSQSTPTVPTDQPTLEGLENSPKPAESGAMGITIEPSGDAAPTSIIYQGYIISSIKSGIVMVDIRKASERILYEQFMEQRAASNGLPVGAQQLLFPVSCNFSPADAELLRELLDDIRGLGFALDLLGNCTLVVSATPPDVKESELQDLFDQLIVDYKGCMMKRFSDRDQMLCASLARQMSKHAADLLPSDRAQSILADLFACRVPDITPSGEKTMIVLNETKLTELFR